SPAPCQSTTRMRSSFTASLKIPARVTYMLDVIAFFFVGRFNSMRRTLPDRSVMISSIIDLLYASDEFTVWLGCCKLVMRRGLLGFDCRRACWACCPPSDEIAPNADRLAGRCARHAEAQCVAHSFFFGPQIREGVRIRRSLAAEHGRYLDAVLRQCARFARIVREQTNPLDPKIAQDRSRQAEVPAIGPEPKGMIGLNRIEADVLQFVCLQLGHQADAAALLILIDHESATFLGDGLHGHLQLVMAIATQRPEYFSGKALRMDAQQGNSFAWIAHDHRECGFNPSSAVRYVALEPKGIEHPPFGRHAGGRNAPKRSSVRSS